MARTNNDLGNDYFLVVSPLVESTSALFNYKRIGNAIRTHSTDLYSHFDQHKSLRGLPGIGKKTRVVLESIILHGVEKTRDLLSGENANKSNKRFPVKFYENGRKIN